MYRGKRTRADWILYGIFMIVFGLCLWVGQLDENTFIEVGVEKTATVKDSYIVKRRGRNNDFNYLVVEYYIDGKKYETRISTSYKTFNRLKDGGTITIYYNPSNPMEARDIEDYGNWGYIVGGIFILAGVACFFVKE